MIEVGSWRNFDEIEESLILDELLLLNEVINKRFKDNFKLMAAANGSDISEMDDEHDTDELPDELLQAEREYRSKQTDPEGFSSLGLGYARV